MQRRRLLNVIIRTWEEACSEEETLTPDRYVVGHVSYQKQAICLGSDNVENYTYHNEIENLVRTIVHETVHWVLWYREDKFIPEQWRNDYEKGACHLFDNVSREMDL